MISDIDLTIIGLYFILVFIIGYVVSRKTETGEDLFLGGRSFGWLAVGLSLFASNISSTTLIGLAGAAYTSGIVTSVYEFAIGIPFVLLAAIYVPLYITSKITTIPEFLELRFDQRSRLFFSAVTIFTSIVVTTSGGLYAGAVVLKTFFPDLVLWQTCFAIALIAGVYTAFGGLKAVVYTDAIQAVILIVGCSFLTYVLFAEIDFSWTSMVNAAPEGHFSVIRPMDDPTVPWAGLIVGVPLLGFWYVATNQYITQRVLGAKNIAHARWGIMLASVLKLLPLFIMVLPGAMMLKIMPGLPDGDIVFPTAVIEFLPVGIVGIVLAGLISAIMSSVDSTLNSASTLIVHDFVMLKKPDMTPKQVARYGSVSTLIVMVIAAAWAPFIANFGGLWFYLQQMFAIIVPPVVILFVLGIFYTRANGTGAFWTLILGTFVGIVLFALGQMGLWPLQFLLNMGLVTAICAVIFVVASNFAPPPTQDVIDRFTYHPRLLSLGNENMPWYLDYRLHSVIVLFLVGLTYYLFR